MFLLRDSLRSASLRRPLPFGENFSDITCDNFSDIDDGSFNNVDYIDDPLPIMALNLNSSSHKKTQSEISQFIFELGDNDNPIIRIKINYFIEIMGGIALGLVGSKLISRMALSYIDYSSTQNVSVWV